MGCWAIVGDATWGPQDEKDSLDTISAALDAGVTTFDTAEGYGAGLSETLLSKALAGRRHKAVVASKVSPDHLTADGVRSACEASLKRLKTDYIDLYQIHWPSRTIGLSETLSALEDLRSEGKIREVGVSNFAVLDLDDLLAAGRVATNQLPYNLLFRAIEYEIAPKCVQNDIDVMCYCPLAQGLLTGKFASPDEVLVGRARTRHFSRNRAQTRHGEEGHEQETFAVISRIRSICERIGESMEAVSLAWLLRQPGIATVVVGARNPEQIRRNAAAADLDLAVEAVHELSAATEALKAALGPNPDMWQTQSQCRMR